MQDYNVMSTHSTNIISVLMCIQVILLPYIWLCKGMLFVNIHCIIEL